MAIYRQRCYAKISKSALLHNYNVIKNYSQSEICAVVKANAYGHDALICSQILQEAGAVYLAVTSINEGIYLRENDITTPVLILSHTPAELAADLVKYNLTQTVASFEYAKDLSASLVGCENLLNVHVKIDSGMSRLGILCQTVDDIASAADEVENIFAIKNLDCEGIFTHLSSADGAETADVKFTQNQFICFKNLIANLKARDVEFKFSHIANSTGVANYPDNSFNMVRCGLSLYGYNNAVRDIDLKPVLSLAAKVISVKNLPKGAPVSYNRTHILQKDSAVATISAGYADGVNRALSNVGAVMIKDKSCKILGRVCMDYVMVDVTNLDVKAGDEALIICDEISATDHAKTASTIEYEILCNISARVPRVLAD